jgi:hypothetical protein
MLSISSPLFACFETFGPDVIHDTVRALSGRLSALSVFHSKSSVLYGAFVWALNRQKRRFPAPRAAACLVHSLLVQKVTSPRFTILNGFRPRRAVGLRHRQGGGDLVGRAALRRGLDEGLLPLTPSNLPCMENPYSYKTCQ